MTLVFVVGVALSAIFQSAEIWSLHKDHPDRKSLWRNSIYKLIIVGFAVACAICFGATYAVCGGDANASGSHSASQCNTITSVCAAFEWTVALILVFYFLTLVADLWPAGKSSERYMRRLAKWQEKNGEGNDFTGRRAFEKHPERWQDRYAAMRQNMWARNNGQETVGRNSMASAAPIVGNNVAPVVDNGSAYPATGYPATGYPVSGYPETGYGAQTPVGAHTPVSAHSPLGAHAPAGYTGDNMVALGAPATTPAYPAAAYTNQTRV